MTSCSFSFIICIIAGFNHHFIPLTFACFLLIIPKTPLFSASTSHALIFFVLHSARGTAQRLDSRHFPSNMSLSSPVYSSALHRRRPAVLDPATWPGNKSGQMPERAPCDAQEPLRPATTLPLAASGSELPTHARNMPTLPSPECNPGHLSALRRYTNAPAPGSNARASSLRAAGSRPGPFARPLYSAMF
ncbi:uncharacterized protein LY79DRAFT_11094 [Colletotrichum navitas]|uniref:Uncharacterized protein n=1 Tax=Colletotrichum navitas TaxID=681940 RepID=A0AAD8QCT7_9PEZI|nr:uncharacterized protein LY79DRAFT_11094 [Colletotrichum navitas]KAK1600211.1 hypothetical protein LY79DRAFT_11094 [Colletotrichum navitas]